MFSEKKVYTPDDLKEFLYSLTCKVQDQAVAARYKEESVLTVSLILSMGNDLIQIDSNIQRITEQCVNQKKYMRNFMQESQDPLAASIRAIVTERELAVKAAQEA